MADADAPKPKMSALALAKRSSDYATVGWTAEDVRRIRPAWDGPKTQYFLERHQRELAAMMLDAARKVLAALIEKHEREARND